MLLFTLLWADIGAAEDAGVGGERRSWKELAGPRGGGRGSSLCIVCCGLAEPLLARKLAGSLGGDRSRRAAGPRGGDEGAGVRSRRRGGERSR